MESMKAMVIRLKKQVPVDANWRRRQCGWGEGTATKPVLVDVECFRFMVSFENYIGRKTFQIYGGRLDAGAPPLFCANWASRRAARAARSRPPRRDLAYWHGFSAVVHRLQKGRLPSHFRWRDRQGRQASDERATRVCCADMKIKGSLLGHRRRDIERTGRVDACEPDLEA
ncbi:unnamed protein product [Clonostachys rosea f. rosea IK726]|uniref:Uncharacterized protein n=1 Tax=Clonostachys rosea f. rosea IK726 TaxID=1349383 RepID=A0ACA9UNG4_BIOOC|nr:unnamed protein product [Clonostachys rosea f. rosea IK726]